MCKEHRKEVVVLDSSARQNDSSCRTLDHMTTAQNEPGRRRREFLSVCVMQLNALRLEWRAKEARRAKNIPEQAVQYLILAEVL